MDVRQLVELVVVPLCSSDNSVVQGAGQAIAWNLVNEGYLVKWNKSSRTDYGRRGVPFDGSVVELYMGGVEYGRRTTTDYFVEDPPLSWEERNR